MPANTATHKLAILRLHSHTCVHLIAALLMTTDCTAQLAEIEIAPLKTKFAVLDRIDAAWALASRGFGMFLAGIDQRAGLESNSHTHILKRFPAQARAEVCKQIVTFLADDLGNIDTVLPTTTHVRWAMEVVGASFQLPMSYRDVIAKSIKIYQAWLGLAPETSPLPSSSTPLPLPRSATGGSKSLQPAAVREEAQSFYQAMIDHMSLLFEPRRTSTLDDDGAQEMHATLCDQVLGVWRELGKSGDALAPKTWVRLLRVAVGTADLLLREDAVAVGAGPSAPALSKHMQQRQTAHQVPGQQSPSSHKPQQSQKPLGEKLCPQLTRTVLELFIRSLSHTAAVRAQLWQLLKSHAVHWANPRSSRPGGARSSEQCARLVALQWCHVSASLTEAVASWLVAAPGTSVGASQRSHQRSGHRSEPANNVALTVSWADWADEVAAARQESETVGVQFSATRTDTVSIDDRSTKLHLPIDLACYAWQRCLHLIGNPSRLRDPISHATALRGLKRITLVLLDPSYATSASSTTLASRTAPSANALLRLVGPWLFDAALSSVRGFEVGKAVAVGALCQVLVRSSNTHATPPHKQHIARLVLAIERGLADSSLTKDVHDTVAANRRQRDQHVRDAITLHGAELCSCRFLPGRFELLTPLLLNNSVTRLHELGNSSNPLTENTVMLRQACLRVLCQCVLLPQASLGNVSVSKLPSTGIVLELLRDVLLQQQVEPETQQVVVWLLVSLTIAEGRLSSIAERVHDVLVDSLRLPPTRSGDAELLSTKLIAVSSLAEFFSHTAHLAADGSEQKHRRARAANQILLLAQQLRERTGVSQTEHAALYLGAMREWVETHPWLLRHELLNRELIAVAVHAQKAANAVERAVAEQLFDQLLCQTARFPAVHGSNSVCVSEANFANAKLPPICYFGVHGQLLTFVETEDQATVICRSAHTQRTAWHFQPCFSNADYLAQARVPEAAESSPVDVSKSGDKDTTTIDPLLQALAQAGDQLTHPPRLCAAYDSTGDCDDGQDARDDGSGVSNGMPRGRKVDVGLPDAQMAQASVQPEQPCKIQSEHSGAVGLHVRLLSHAGLLSPSTWGKLIKLDDTPKMWADVRELDRAPVREQLSCRVEFVTSSSAVQGGSIKTFTAASAQEARLASDFDVFQRFCDSLAPLIDLHSHAGYAGGAPRIRGAQGLYHCTQQEELFFHVKALQDNQSSESEPSRRLQAVIIFVSSDCDVEPPPRYWRSGSSAESTSPIIVVEPRGCSLYRVSVDDPSGRATTGPILDGMVISERQLGLMCRRTVVNFWRRKLIVEHPPSASRRRKLERIVLKYHTENLPGDWLNRCYLIGAARSGARRAETGGVGAGVGAVT